MWRTTVFILILNVPFLDCFPSSSSNAKLSTGAGSSKNPEPSLANIVEQSGSTSIPVTLSTDGTKFATTDHHTTEHAGSSDQGASTASHIEGQQSREKDHIEHHKKENYPIIKIDFMRVATPFIICAWVFLSGIAKIGKSFSILDLVPFYYVIPFIVSICPFNYEMLES